MKVLLEVSMEVHSPNRISLGKVKSVISNLSQILNSLNSLLGNETYIIVTDISRTESQ